MPLDIKKNEGTAPGAPQALVDMIAGVIETLRDLRVEVRRGKVWEEAQIYVGYHRLSELIEAGAEPAEEQYDEPPEEVAEAVWEEARRHAQQNGSAEYRVTARGLDAKGKYGIVGEHVFRIGVDDQGEAISVDASTEQVDTLKLAKGIAKDAHERYMAVSGELVKMAKEMSSMTTSYSQICGPMAEAMVQLKKLDIDQATAEAEERGNEAFMREVGSSIRPFAEAFAPEIAKVFAEHMRGQANRQQPGQREEGETVHQVSAYAARFDAIIAPLGDDKIRELEEILGEDIWNLVGALRIAQDDGTFRNVALQFEKRVREAPESAKMMEHVSAIIGVKGSMELMKLINEVK